MGLFDFLKGNKNKNVELYNPVDGEVIPIEEVSDPVFSQKMMGDGFGVEPTNGDVYSPIKGEVVSVFPTKHAVGLKAENGVEVLVHIGVDTVELDGAPFEVFVSEGDKVSETTKLATVDLEALKAADKPDTVIIVFTNMDDVDNYSLTSTGSRVHGDVIGEVSSN